MLKNYLLLLLVGMIWGSQFVFQELALQALSPLWLGVWRAVLGALTLCFICKLMRVSGRAQQWRLFALIALLEASLPFVLVPWAQQQLSAAVTAVLLGTLPFYVLILAPLFTNSSTLNRSDFASLLLGFSGVLVLFAPEFISAVPSVDLLSALAVLLAALCFAIALLLLQRVQAEHPLWVARNVLVMASVQLVGMATLSTVLPVTQWPFSATTMPATAMAETVMPETAMPAITIFWLTDRLLSLETAPAIAAVLYLGVICAGLVYYLYMLCIQRAGAVFSSMTNYLVPAVGVLLAAAFSDDMITANTWLALGLILVALWVNQHNSTRSSTSHATGMA